MTTLLLSSLTFETGTLAVMTFFSLAAFVVGLAKKTYVIGVFGCYSRVTWKGTPVRFILFGMIYLTVTLLLAYSFALSFMEWHSSPSPHHRLP